MNKPHTDNIMPDEQVNKLLEWFKMKYENEKDDPL